VSKFLELTFNFFVFVLIVISLYPGSLIGYALYGDLTLQPNIIKNPFGTAINHFICYFFISLFGFYVYLKNKKFHRLVYKLYFLSVTLEVMQFFVPNRAFQLYDLAGNFLGVLVAFFLVKIYLIIKKKQNE
tara:strand:+ start:5673 stop:6065 length:393 start_codon:yes stop_codon:yes gene_type:complete